MEIWLTKNEVRDEVLNAKLKRVFSEYKKKKYSVVVYQSGVRNLTDGMEMLLRINREKIAQESAQGAVV